MRINIIVFFCLLTLICKSQNSKINFGIQYKPIIPSAYFNSSTSESFFSSYNFNLTPKYSNSFGMLIKNKITKIFYYEFGINYIKRNFHLEIKNPNINLTDLTLFDIRSYETPIQLLAFIQISKLWYLNTSFGLSHNILASDVFSYGEKNSNYLQNTYRKNGGYQALLANIGMEYKNSKKGNYYLGVSLHRPWKTIARIYPEYKIDGINNDELLENAAINIPGNFLTLDIRYFFPN